MPFISKTFFTLAFTCLLTGCVTVPEPEPIFTYNEVVILNRLRIPVLDVTLEASATGRVFSCGNIAPRGICSNKFPVQPYYGKPLNVSWRNGDGTRYERTVELELPERFVVEIPLRGVFVIESRSQISAYLQQEPRGPHF